MMSSLKLISCLILVLLCVLESGVQGKEDVPLTKFGSKTGPTLKFFYCYSCGYRKVFEEYVGILRQKYPELQIYGENYNPPGYSILMAKFLGIAKILIIVLILSGVNIFQWIGQPAPFVWQWCIDNRLYACILLFFMSNAVEGQMISSGAFEIHFNDVPVWSKLETGRIPQPQELFQIIDNHMQMMFPEMDMAKPMAFSK
ncbi:thioredoxin reductase-like selenoprotein T homolog CG3887 [Belonocnema kinseyi]|uniref:thioredoxin reductase-like selenoprotein T homolog CG3887 n=1 Tax=Belonocnema kinseyi TaxID=2817044 RepID=UPI00143E0212|nr:thioredoxin reductase-like selenoprotein T homolog CG3887 [Belonocnema kinseyi]